MEFRKIIRTTLREYLNEEHINENFILWEDLPLSIKNDITENLRDEV